MRAPRRRAAAGREEKVPAPGPACSSAGSAHPVLALQRSAGNQAVAAALGRVHRQPVNPADDAKPPTNLGPPVSEVPLPPMGGFTYKNGQWHWWGKNLPIPLVGNTGDIPLDPRKIPDILKGGDKDKRKKADCRGHPSHPHAAGSDAFLGQCCESTIESAERCCLPERLNTRGQCCKPGQAPVGDKCEEATLPPGWTPPGITFNWPTTPGPQVQPPPPPQPLKLDLTAGVVDDFDINSSALNSRQTAKVEAVKSAVRSQVQMCPGTWIEIIGHADKPGGEATNLKLGWDRADRIKMVLQVDLLTLPPSGLLSLKPGGLMMTRSEGATGATPGGPGAGGEYNAKDRKVEVITHALCEPVSQTLTPPGGFGSSLPGLGGSGGPGGSGGFGGPLGSF